MPAISSKPRGTASSSGRSCPSELLCAAVLLGLLEIAGNHMDQAPTCAEEAASSADLRPTAASSITSRHGSFRWRKLVFCDRGTQDYTLGQSPPPKGVVTLPATGWAEASRNGRSHVSMMRVPNDPR